jgi:hypothetical protein
MEQKTPVVTFFQLAYFPDDAFAKAAFDFFTVAAEEKALFSH